MPAVFIFFVFTFMLYRPELDEDINLEGMSYDNHLCSLSPSEDTVVYCGES